MGLKSLINGAVKGLSKKAFVYIPLIALGFTYSEYELQRTSNCCEEALTAVENSEAQHEMWVARYRGRAKRFFEEATARILARNSRTQQ